MKLYSYRVAARVLDRIREHELFLIDVKSELLLDGRRDLLRSYGTEGPAALAALDLKGNGLCLKLLSELDSLLVDGLLAGLLLCLLDRELL